MAVRNFVNDVQNIMNSHLSLGNKLGDIHEKGQDKILFKGCGCYMVYSLDVANHNGQLKGFEPFPFFSKNEKKLNAVNDYLIFAKHPKKNEIYVIIIELKQKDNPYVQLWAGKQLSEYIIKRLNAVYGTKYKPKYRMLGCVSASHKAALKADKIRYNKDGMCLKHFKAIVLEDLLH